MSRSSNARMSDLVSGDLSFLSPYGANYGLEGKMTSYGHRGIVITLDRVMDLSSDKARKVALNNIAKELSQ